MGIEIHSRKIYDLLYDPAVGRATMMGYPCVRLAGRFLACYDDRARCLVVKLPKDRVLELIEDGDGDPFAPAGRDTTATFAAAGFDTDRLRRIQIPGLPVTGEWVTGILPSP